MSLALPDCVYGTPNHEDVRNTAAERAEIERHIEEFLARGGEIQQIPAGVSAYNARVVTVKNGRTTTKTWADEKMRGLRIDLTGTGSAARTTPGIKAAMKRQSEAAEFRRQRHMPEVLRLRAEGLSYAAIGRELGVSGNTVMNWVRREAERASV
ncbi:helix-turn-helix domain-containing protein [Microbulbifer thermotolerans]|uniref:Helix-turn-helix domain-containing protein n=1 Tax=Microbulbifer thermotolerans TaxID=252514 RepID=A0AB35HXQ7_MICTH|nr:helix-turn-helix domain-containing protein [Microbulbifer thermotolerans]MCX2780405.1 helix-turn-helix domain-containing protein [Microbulbifer thermotolerans]MCX2802239.1 helix-turn-helix domain-containing protein [Microbulbifer thermotolerans]MCX2805923.1 helix-turn-helix domain-containing protein [Microbulbifer thermotolerans]